MRCVIAIVLQAFVSPSGNDAGPGTEGKPFATIARARQAARVIVLQAGTHRLTDPLIFGPEDSGVSITASPGTHPVISGGRPITDWSGADGVWSAPAPWKFRELFVDGVRRPRARHPSDGYLRVAKAGPDRRTSFTFKAGDLPALSSGELVFLHDWSTSLVPIQGVDPATRTLTTMHPIGPSAAHYAIDNFEPHPRYFVENARALLDAPGEWFLDETAGRVHYRGDKPDAVAPVAAALVVARGVKNLRFQGITFRHCGWSLPETGYGGSQATFHKGGPVGAALRFENTENGRLEDCVIEQVGGAALWFSGRENLVSYTRIRDVGGNGVMIGDPAPKEATAGNMIYDCLIEECGRVFYGAVGVWIGLAERTDVQRNEIRSLPYTGISVGWRWDPKPTPCKGNQIEQNHIHHVMQTLSDGGAIYTLGLQPGTILARNHIHDIPAAAGRAPSNGMFLDEGTTSITIEENVFHDVAQTPLRFHKATTNLVRRNRYLPAPGVEFVEYNSTDKSKITLENNSVGDASKDPVVRQAGPRPR